MIISQLITVEYRIQKEWVLTEEDEHVLHHGSHETAVYSAIKNETGTSQAELLEEQHIRMHNSLSGNTLLNLVHYVKHANI